MDLRPTDEQAALVEELHRIAERQVRPAARDCEEAGAVSPALRSALEDLGVAVPVPEGFGGQGLLDAVTGVLVAEELGWGDPGVAYGVLSSGAAASVVAAAGTAAQQGALLPRLADGSLRGALAVAEREAGGDVFRLEATAAEGPGGLPVLTGTKYAVAGGAQAGVLVVAAAGPSLWLVHGGEGAAVPEDKLGLRSAATAKLLLEGAAAELLGEAASPAVVTALLAARLLNAGIAVGLARAAVEYAAAYARERTAFGKPIGAFQGVSFMIAERAVDVDAARLLVWEAACALDAGRPDAPRLVAAAGGHAAACAVAAGDTAIQVLGGHGYMRDHPAELWFRDAMTLAALEAPSLAAGVVGGRAPVPSR